MAMAAKLVSMAIALLSVPMLLNLLGTHDYGAWATLTSLIAFISLLDLGVGNSLRNSVASMQPGVDNVQTEFVGFFQLLCLVGVLTAIVFVFVLPVLSLPPGSSTAALFLYLPLLLLLPLLLGANVLQGARATGLQAVLQSLSAWLFFGFIALLTWRSAHPSLPVLATAWASFYTFGLLLTFIIALRVLGLPKHILLKWSLFQLPKDRLRIGLEFLILQLSSLVLYSLGNMLVFSYLGAEEVARYDILNKVFQVALSLYTIVIGVMWSEIAKQRAANESAALSRTLRKLYFIALIFSVVCIAGAVAVPKLIEFWTHGKIGVTITESISVAGLVAVQSFAYVGAVFMNAFEKIRLQILLGIASIALMVPLSVLLIGQGLGIASVPFSALLLTLLPMIICNFAAVKLIKNTSLKQKAALA
ncbi:lipopolysaccharide biosynthesis protein [Paucibacter sp. KCTC 42545]|uniref:lipopolysaccharide biosynthesis protein n=1 Tax=Paucibacter sp. KCTC 42545 TaxID=1768242 RepID=UPI002FF7A4DE